MKLLLLLLPFLLSAPGLSAADKLNVLFIAVDDLRPDLGCYGVPHAKSPHIDRLAARGVVFERAYCQQAVCSPSRTSILTGLRPDVTKVWDLQTHYRVALPKAVTLPQHFTARGYRTEGLGKIYHNGYEDSGWTAPHWYASGRTVAVDPNDWTQRRTSTFPGVVEYMDPLDRVATRAASGKAKAGPAFEVSSKSDDELPDGATAAEAVKRIAAAKADGRPFFLAVGFVKPHLPFVAPKKYWDLHDPAAIPGPATDKLPEGTAAFTGHDNGELHAYPGVPKGNPIPDDFARILRHGYNACVSYMDAQVGRLLDALEKEGLADKTIVILWGDHGWQLGDHGLWHKHTNFERATRAPLIISLPGAAGAGKKCAATAEFVDIFPTLADLAGLPVPDGLAGRSLRKYLETPALASDKPAISQYPRSGFMGYSIRNDRWRATFWRKRNAAEITHIEFYDEQNDPAETKNLAELPEHRALLESLKKHLPPAGADAPGPKIQADAVKPGGFDPKEPRDKRYDRLYPGKAQLTLDEYLKGQSGEKEAARERFRKMDRNSDGTLTREEFIGKI